MTTATSVNLREVHDEDIDIFFEHQADPVAVEMAAFPSRDLDTHDAHWRTQRSRPEVVLRTIEYKGSVAGNIVSWPHGGRREIGYWIGREYWGRGIATAALTQFVEVVDERPLVAFVRPGNEGSRRVLTKCGFHQSDDVVDDGEGPMLQYVLDDRPPPTQR